MNFNKHQCIKIIFPKTPIYAVNCNMQLARFKHAFSHDEYVIKCLLDNTIVSKIKADGINAQHPVLDHIYSTYGSWLIKNNKMAEYNDEKHRVIIGVYLDLRVDTNLKYKLP